MSSPASAFDLIGVGSPIMDLLAPVPESFLATVRGDKGGMVLVDDAEMQSIVTRLPAPPAAATGGSAANTTFNVARLGLRTAFLGKLGNDDNARIYRERFAAAGVDGSHFKQAAQPNARCLSLVTPDAQRTMRTCLGAAMTLAPEEITPADFQGCRHAHVEGYLLFNRALAEAVVNAARTAGCTLSIDLASFEVAAAARNWLLAQLGHGVDIVFANEDEIRALFDTTSTDYAAHTRALAARGTLAVVKLGKDGAYVGRGAELHRIEPVHVASVVDTTGAGDAFAAGFLYGHLRGLPLPVSGHIAAVLGAETVRHLGPLVPSQDWSAIATRVQQFR
jgi:sugar/nucleoside kinase (ribokinase family)